jgi:TonB family protein
MTTGRVLLGIAWWLASVSIAQAGEIHFTFGLTRTIDACEQAGPRVRYRVDGRWYEIARADVKEITGLTCQTQSLPSQVSPLAKQRFDVCPRSGDPPFAGQRFQLPGPPLDVSASPPRGDVGNSGREGEGGPAIPLGHPPDADHAGYFLMVKKAIEAHWSYPTQAARNGESGRLRLEFAIRKDGQVLVELIQSSGVEILDRYAVDAVKAAAPFPRLPDPLGDTLRVSASFTYVLDPPSKSGPSPRGPCQESSGPAKDGGP